MIETYQLLFQKLAKKQFIILFLALGINIEIAANVLEEVVVTAQKREQSLNDVGIAVTAFSGSQMEQLGFESSTDIVAMSPGVFISTDTAGQNRKFTVRGVTQNDFVDSVEAPVAVYVDEGYIAPQQGQAFGLFDVERVEILKGPQGTLFGRNATGGLVHYLTRPPELDEVGGYGKATYGSYDQARFEGAVNLPINEISAARVSVLYNRHDKLTENQYPLNAAGLNPNPAPQSDLQDDDTWAVRGRLLFSPNDELEILLSGYASQTETTSGAYESEPSIAIFDALGRHIDTQIASSSETREAIGPNGAAVGIPFLDGEIPGFTEDATRPVAGGDFFGHRDSDTGDFKTSQDFAEDDLNSFDSYGVNAKLSWDLDENISLTSVTDAKFYDKFIGLDASGAPASQFAFMSDAKTDTVTQELRFDGNTDRGSRWVTGLYFLYIDNETRTGLPFRGDSVLAFSPPPNGLDLNPLDVNPGPGVDLVSEISLETISFSLFGQMEFDINDQLTLITGLRGVLEEKDYTFAQNSYVNTNDRALDSSVFGVSITPSVNDEISELLWTGKIQLDYKPNEDILIYGGINRGVKAGSFNGPLPDGTPFLANRLAYEEEVLLSYEVGFKSTLLDGKARFNGAFYYYDYSDYQAFTFTNVNGVITNEDANVLGMEIDLTLQPTNGLDIILGFSYTDAEVEDLEIANGIFRDVSATFTPEIQLSGLVRYAWPLFGGEMSLQMDATYVSDHYYNLRNFSAHEIDGYVLGNARASWETEDGKWQFSAFVDNVSDKRYIVENFDLATLSGNNTLRYGNPRWAGGSVKYSY